MPLRSQAALLLLFVGIHNAWDAAAYYVLVHRVGAHTEPQGHETVGADKPGIEKPSAG